MEISWMTLNPIKYRGTVLGRTIIKYWQYSGWRTVKILTIGIKKSLLIDEWRWYPWWIWNVWCTKILIHDIVNMALLSNILSRYCKAWKYLLFDLKIIVKWYWQMSKRHKNVVHIYILINNNEQPMHRLVMIIYVNDLNNSYRINKWS